MPPERGVFYPVSAKDMWAFGITVENDVLQSWFPGRGPRISTIVKETLRNARWHDSLCLQALHKIPLLALKKLHARPSDDQMLKFIHRSYDGAMEVKTLFSFMLNHGAVMLSHVSKKRSSMFHYRGDRDVFITPRLDSTVYKHVYGCEGLPLHHMLFCDVETDTVFHSLHRDASVRVLSRCFHRVTSPFISVSVPDMFQTFPNNVRCIPL